MPDWYGLLRAARFLGVAPWDLLDQSAMWLDWALLAEGVEQDVAAEMRQRELGSAS